ncbi:MAG: flavin reductase family protein [Anaerolineae bacterium]|nr:flavin reductase family protein [Anaerolineae bacterium]
MSEISGDLRATMRLWTCGVTVVTTASGDRRSGMTVSSFTSISLDPPQVLVCLQKYTPTAQLVQESGVFAVSLLGTGQDRISDQFAGYTDLPDGADRFHGVDTVSHKTGAPVLAVAVAWLDCRVSAVHDGGTHFIFVGDVVATGRNPDPVSPLVYHNRQYWRLTQ